MTSEILKGNTTLKAERRKQGHLRLMVEGGSSPQQMIQTRKSMNSTALPPKERWTWKGSTGQIAKKRKERRRNSSLGLAWIKEEDVLTALLLRQDPSSTAPHAGGPVEIGYRNDQGRGRGQLNLYKLRWESQIWGVMTLPG